jgi:hypothetical protein
MLIFEQSDDIIKAISSRHPAPAWAVFVSTTELFPPNPKIHAFLHAAAVLQSRILQGPWNCTTSIFFLAPLSSAQ